MAETHHTGIPRLQWSGSYPPCTPSVVITADLNPFCAGDSVTFTPTFACVENVTISLYIWAVNGVLVSSSSDPFVSTSLADGDRVFLAFTLENGNTYFSNVISMVEKTVGCEVSGLELTFDDIANVPVADASSVSDWNTFFDLPTNGNPFTSVDVVGNVVTLNGGSSIIVKDYLFFENLNLLSILHGVEIMEANEGSFGYCDNLTEVSLLNMIECGNQSFAINSSLLSLNFPSLITAGEGAFTSNQLVNTINFPLLETAGNQCFNGLSVNTIFRFPSLLSCGNDCFKLCIAATEFYLPSCLSLGTTTGNDDVFFGITGQTITLTIPAALMTCNAGNPDGDIQYLAANNTLTIIQV